MKARKKPVVVEVMKYSRVSPRIHRLCREFVGDSWIEDVPRFSPMFESVSGIKTLEGVMEVSNGDYIIKGVNGEFYPCKPDIFHKTYDIIED